MLIKCHCGCGEEFEEKNIYGGKRRFVYGHHLRLRIGNKNPNFRKIKELNPNWKGGKTYDRNGYVYVFYPEHPFCNSKGYIMEHRFIMEGHLGRYLTKEEKIHHINGDKKDNKIQNLMLFPNHSKHLTYERTKDMSNRFCKICEGKTYINKRGFEQWYGDEINGWVCSKCYKKL